MFVKISEDDFNNTFQKWIDEKQLKNKKETIIIEVGRPIYHNSYDDDFRTESPDNNYEEIRIKESLDIDSLEDFMNEIFKKEMLGVEIEPKYLEDDCFSFYDEYYDEWYDDWMEHKKQDYEEDYER